MSSSKLLESASKLLARERKVTSDLYHISTVAMNKQGYQKEDKGGNFPWASRF